MEGDSNDSSSGLNNSSDVDADLMNFLDNLDDPNLYGGGSVDSAPNLVGAASTIKPEDPEDLKLVDYLKNFENKDSTLVRKVDSMLGESRKRKPKHEVSLEFNPFKKGGGKGLLSMKNLNITGAKKKRRKKKSRLLSPSSSSKSLEKMVFESNHYFEHKVKTLKRELKETKNKSNDYEMKLNSEKEEKLKLEKERVRILNELKSLKTKLLKSEETIKRKDKEIKTAKLEGGKKSGFLCF